LEKEQIRPYARLKFKDDICYVYFNQDLEVTDEIIEDIHQTGLFMSEGKAHCMLVDLSLNVSSTNEARKYGANNEFMKHHIAYALIGKSIAVNLFANFFIKINKPKIETKLFSNEKDALIWLQNVRKQINKRNRILEKS